MSFDLRPRKRVGAAGNSFATREEIPFSRKGLCFLQHDFDVANGSGATVRADLNNAIEALATLSSGAIAPGTTYTYQLWADTTAGLLKQRNAANTAWEVRGTLAETLTVNRSTNTIIAAGDFGKTFICTSTFTQTLTAAATLGDGFMCWIRNDGTGVITIDPNSSETIDGTQTIELLPGDSCLLFCDGANWKTLGRTQSAMQLIGACRLTKSGSNLLLSRYNGSKLLINSKWENIPAAGVTLAPTGATADTTYYIYAFMSAGVMTLEFSATAPAADTTYGHQIKTADATRTLVGMARAVTGPAWADTDAQRFVLSYFNRRLISGKNHFTANRSTASTADVELNSEIRCEFLTWSDEGVQVSADGQIQHNTTGGSIFVSLAFDGTTGEACYFKHQFYTATADSGFAVGLIKSGLSEGYHYATVIGAVGSGTGTFTGSATVNRRCSLRVGVAG